MFCSASLRAAGSLERVITSVQAIIGPESPIGRSTISRKTVIGRTRAKSATNSHSPRGASFSISAIATSRARASRPASALGMKAGWISRR
jgi:hypothetical protein